MGGEEGLSADRPPGRRDRGSGWKSRGLVSSGRADAPPTPGGLILAIQAAAADESAALRGSAM
ncbi:hypothetical protein BCD48_15720 [Pseudofrankia sp. BMG5.36]|nr:hypothetical protein BCD48_15720 [Pseudofrankia sp. BMG5.36]